METEFNLKFRLDLRGQDVCIRCDRTSWCVSTGYRAREVRVDDTGPDLYSVDGRLFSTPEKVLEYVWTGLSNSLANRALAAIEEELRVPHGT